MKAKGRDLQFKAKIKRKTGSDVDLLPPDIKGHGRKLSFSYFIVATCKADNCTLWNGRSVPSSQFP